MTRVGSLARALLLILAAEGGAYLWLGSAIWRAQGGTAAILIVALLALAVRAVPVLLFYAIALAGAGPVPAACRVGRLARLGYVAAEIGAAAAIYSVLHPFAWLLMPREPERGEAGGREPVLLVHGYLCNRGVWRSLARWLRARGHAVYTVDLEPVFGGIDGYAEIIAARLDSIAGATGRKVQVIAASLGGLAVRACLRRYGSARVARVITLGSPHHGSRHAWLALGVNGCQMRPGSEWLQALAQAEGAAPAVPFVSIYSCHDNMVSPVESSRLDGASNLAIAGVGHLSLAFSRQVRRVLAEQLA